MGDGCNVESYSGLMRRRSTALVLLRVSGRAIALFDKGGSQPPLFLLFACIRYRDCYA
jgi:hypothetical protein